MSLKSRVATPVNWAQGDVFRHSCDALLAYSGECSLLSRFLDGWLLFDLLLLGIWLRVRVCRNQRGVGAPLGSISSLSVSPCGRCGRQRAHVGAVRRALYNNLIASIESGAFTGLSSATNLCVPWRCAAAASSCAAVCVMRAACRSLRRPRAIVRIAAHVHEAHHTACVHKAFVHHTATVRRRCTCLPRSPCARLIVVLWPP